MNDEQARRAAQEYMRDKGYPNIEPIDFDHDEELDQVWYFDFQLPQGVIELEVAWDGKRWWWDVLDFVPRQWRETARAGGR